MQEAQFRVAMVMSGLFLGGALLVYFWEPSEEDTDPDATEYIWEVDRETVTRIEVDRDDGPLILQKTGDRWRLESPMDEPADPAQVDFLLGDLERVDKGIPIPDADPTEFGFEPAPVVSVKVTDDAGEVQELIVGDKAPVGWRTYVLAADGSIVAVAGIIGERLLMEVEDLRDDTVVQFDPGEVRRVVIESEYGTLDVSGEGKHWFLEGFTRADPGKVDDLVMGLREVHFASFFEDVAPEGIADPEFDVTIESTDGTTGFRVGESGPLGKLVRSEEGRTGWVDPDSIAILGMGPTDIGDRLAFPIDMDESVSLAVELGDIAFEATRGEETWSAEGMEDDKARTAVEMLSIARVKYRREPVPDPDETFGTVTITWEEDEPTIIDLGQEIDGEYRVAKDRAGGSAYLVPLGDIEDFTGRLPSP